VTEPKPAKRSKAFEQFRDFTKRVIAVPKREIDRREGEYKIERAEHKRVKRQPFK
jgi:hypothetical protein